MRISFSLTKKKEREKKFIRSDEIIKRCCEEEEMWSILRKWHHTIFDLNVCFAAAFGCLVDIETRKLSELRIILKIFTRNLSTSKNERTRLMFCDLKELLPTGRIFYFLAKIKSFFPESHFKFIFSCNKFFYISTSSSRRRAFHICLNYCCQSFWISIKVMNIRFWVSYFLLQ